MKRPHLAKLALLAVSVTFSLLLCELAVRVMDLAPELAHIEKWRMRLSKNPKIGFEPIPNLDSTGKQARHYSYLGRSNNEGFRDSNHPLNKPAGTRRVIVIGDSVAAGIWVNDDQAVFPVVMERRLQDMGLETDVLNMGVSGYNTQQEVETLKDKGLKYVPDLVILAYCLNDRVRDDGRIYGRLLREQILQGEENKRVDVTSLEPLVERSALLRFLIYVVAPKLSPTKPAANRVVDINRFAADTVDEYFDILAALGRQHDFEVLVTVFPEFGKEDQALLHYPTEYADEHARVLKLAQDNGFYSLDLLPSFQDCKKKQPPGGLISFDRYHPRAIGYRCAGLRIAEKVASIWQVP